MMFFFLNQTYESGIGVWVETLFMDYTRMNENFQDLERNIQSDDAFKDLLLG